jgi:hypothetical protein
MPLGPAPIMRTRIGQGESIEWGCHGKGIGKGAGGGGGGNMSGGDEDGQAWSR